MTKANPHLDLHYVEPRLVAQYDLENASRHDTDFYLALADQVPARKIVDLGCGTGVLARDLAATGREVWGVDPAATMLDYARRQPGAERVQWINGDSGSIGTPDADLAVMTGNVAQVFLEDADWQSTLNHLHSALRPGGILAFESRNPAARPWEQWAAETGHDVFDTPNGPVETWLEVMEVWADRVNFVGHNLFVDTGELLSVESVLRFRSEQEISASLRQAGFTVLQVYGDWQHTPFSADSPFMVFIAQREAISPPPASIRPPQPF